MDNYREVIRQKISNIDNDQKKTVFALLTCERLYPNYLYFSNKYKFGNAFELENIIKVLFNNIVQSNIQIDIDSFIEVVENITPDTEDFDTILVSFALDACTSLLSTLSFLKDNNMENIVDVAIYARDTVDMYIQERDNLDVNSKELEVLIEQDKFMKNEKRRQIDIIEYLSRVSVIKQNNLEDLRNITIPNIIDLNLLSKN